MRSDSIQQDELLISMGFSPSYEIDQTKDVRIPPTKKSILHLLRDPIEGIEIESKKRGKLGVPNGKYTTFFGEPPFEVQGRTIEETGTFQDKNQTVGYRALLVTPQRETPRRILAVEISPDNGGVYINQQEWTRNHWLQRWLDCTGIQIPPQKERAIASDGKPKFTKFEISIPEGLYCLPEPTKLWRSKHFSLAKGFADFPCKPLLVRTKNSGRLTMDGGWPTGTYPIGTYITETGILENDGQRSFYEALRQEMGLLGEGLRVSKKIRVHTKTGIKNFRD